MGHRSGVQLSEWGAEQQLRRGGLLHPPLYLGFRALAWSCPTCGDLRTTPDYLIRVVAGERQDDCPRCHVARAARYARERAARDEEWRLRQLTRNGQRFARRNAASRDSAANHGKEWTGPDLEIALRADLTAAQAAAILGRTIKAVQTQRDKRREPRTQFLAGIPEK